MAKNSYTDKDIIHLKGLQAVRKRPGVYVGDITSPSGVFQLIKEGVDNAIDEALAGYCKHIKVYMNLVSREVIISDDGRGIPQKSLPIVFGKLHSGSKFSDKVYNISCFIGRTQLRLLNGEIWSMKDLTKYKANDKFWVVSSEENGNVVPGLAHSPRITGWVKRLVEVTLDTGEKEYCTPDHLWHRRDGSYTEAQDLKPDDALMPCYTKQDKIGHTLFHPNILNQVGLSKNRERLKQTSFIPMYKTVHTFFNPDSCALRHATREILQYHHRNFKAIDNSPNNIVLIKKSIHLRLHAKQNRKDPVWVKRNRKNIIRYNRSKKGRDASRKVGLVWGKINFAKIAQDPDVIRKKSKQFKKSNRDEDIKLAQQRGKVIRTYSYVTDVLGLSFNGHTYDQYRMWGSCASRKIPELFSSLQELIENVPPYWEYKRKHGLGTKEELLAAYKPGDKIRQGNNYNKGKNHKVKVVRRVKLKKAIPVYDITVEKYHNFLLASGVFVHNSGIHGVGVSSTNALSSVFECFSIREGKSVWVKYKKGELIKGPAKKKPEKTIRVNSKHGTIIRFIPDFSVVLYKKLPYKMILHWLEAIPLLCPGLKIEVSISSKKKTVEKTFFSKAGLKGQKKGKDLYAKRDNLELCVSFLSEETKVLGYINTIAVREGSHLKAFWQALKASLNKYAKKKSPRQASLKEGVQGIFHVLAKDPLYIGQTKEILGDTRIEKWVYTDLKSVFDKYFENHVNIANKIIKRALVVEALDKEHRSKLKSLKGIDIDIRRGRLPAALAISSTKNKEERELFICEGESAGGTGKAARDRRYQEILPVKGKILNVARKLDKPDKVLKSEEIQNIIKAIGGIDPDKGRVGKIILLSDSDFDGFHITALASTLFVLTLPKWMQEGRVYTVIGPLFHTIHKGKRYFGDTAKEVQNQIKGKANIMRVKGWGEMKPEDLRYVALDPDTRVIKRLVYDKKSSRKTMALMGSDTHMRKRLLGLD